MTYFIAVFGFIMLAATFSASFFEPVYIIILMAASVFGGVGFCFFGKKSRDIVLLFAAAFVGFSLVFTNEFCTPIIQKLILKTSDFCPRFSKKKA